ncbi:NACHT domain-containing protein [Streptomyces syringium]|uniref:NACHT domain-containing protein n=1 Tax=Streptomyces syringium TaxID=76729 RepID=UPI00345252A3
MHPAMERIAAVFGASQGSGYLLTPRLVLTAGHVVRGADEVRVIVPGGLGTVTCRVVWMSDDRLGRSDAALLVADFPLVSVDVAHSFEPLAVGLAADLRAWPGAQAVGFPQLARDADDELDTEQFVGTFKPGSRMLSGRHVLDVEHGVPEASEEGKSPWAGMSGAAVFVNGMLVGVVCEDPAGWWHGRLTVMPMRCLMLTAEYAAQCAQANHQIVMGHLSSPRELETVAFEGRLRDYLVKKASELTIVGLTLSDGDAEVWPLDAAYLSLELSGAAQRDQRGQQDIAPSVTAMSFASPSTPVGPTPQRVEDALAGQKRVLLRGAAGSGKTTLLQWLATITAKDELPPGLSHLEGCVPLTLPLRTLIREGALPRPEEFLAVAAGPLAGLPGTRGWVTGRLTEGSVLLLIDGVDEVPEADRRRTLVWLKDLLAAYPETRYVVTTRPSAVREGWLADAGFTELELLPMSQSDVATFIERWHMAAARCAHPDGGQERDRLRTFQQALTAAVVRKPDLGRLATNPLMCALICALNRARRGYLPHGRMDLYRAALELLLVRRDREREIRVGTDKPELDQAQQVALLQKIAYWLIRNGRSEIEWHRAVEIVERALPAMPSVAASGDAEGILHHLVLRSGLLRRPTSETLDFIHRTFQDYLGAQAAMDDWDFDLLVNNAHDDQWEDVLRMAVGHAPPRARAELLGMLLTRGEREPAHRNRLRLLAAACLEHATEVDPAVRTRVEEATAELVPPTDLESAKDLAAAGQVVIDLLPGPEGLADDVAHAVVVAATTVADERAIPLLAEYATHPFLEVRAQLVWAWDRFDADRYADAVIGKLPYVDDQGEMLEFVVKSRAHLAALKRLGGRPWVQCRGPLTGDDLAELSTPALTDLSFQGNPEVIDLLALRSCPPLRSLRVSQAKGVTGLGALDSRELQMLSLALTDCPDELERVLGMGQLRILSLQWNPLEGVRSERFERVVAFLPTKLQYLGLGAGIPAGPWLSRVAHHPWLHTLMFDGAGVLLSEWFTVSGIPMLKTLNVLNEDLQSLQYRKPMPQVTTLILRDPDALDGLAHISRAYPRLRKLRITKHSPFSQEPLDLAPLRNLGPVAIRVEHFGPVLNEDQLPPGSRLTVS